MKCCYKEERTGKMSSNTRKFECRQATQQTPKSLGIYLAESFDAPMVANGDVFPFQPNGRWLSMARVSRTMMPCMLQRWDLGLVGCACVGLFGLETLRPTQHPNVRESELLATLINIGTYSMLHFDQLSNTQHVLVQVAWAQTPNFASRARYPFSS